MSVNPREERHGEFIMLLGERKAATYTDGGPALKASRSAKRRATARRAKASRKAQRLAGRSCTWERP